jgi:hypothetical protein
VNVKRAVATVAGAIGVFLLAAVVGLGHVAGHPVSTPAKATLTAIYGDSVNVPASTSSTSGSSTTSSSSTPGYVDNSSSYTSVYGDAGSASPASSNGGSIYGDGTGSIYGDSSSSSGAGIYGDGSSGVTQAIYGD